MADEDSDEGMDVNQETVPSIPSALPVVSSIPPALPAVPSRLATAFNSDPVLDNSIQEMRREDEERRRKRLRHNNVLEMELPDDRCGTTDWCCCQKDDGTKGCSKKSHSRASYCCKDSEIGDGGKKRAKMLKQKGDGLSCIVRHGEFSDIALNRTAVSNYARLLAETGRGSEFKEQYNNRELRYAAYRSSTLWIFGRLGRNNRCALPACIVDAIRNAFPKLAGESYVGFRASRTEEMTSSDEETSDDE